MCQSAQAVPKFELIFQEHDSVTPYLPSILPRGVSHTGECHVIRTQDIARGLERLELHGLRPSLSGSPGDGASGMAWVEKDSGGRSHRESKIASAPNWQKLPETWKHPDPGDGKKWPERTRKTCQPRNTKTRKEHRHMKVWGPKHTSKPFRPTGTANTLRPIMF